MDNLWLIRTLTTAINAMRAPGRRIFQRHFAPKLHMEPSDRLAFEVISGSEEVLSTINVHAPATVGSKTGRKVITMEAPRLAEKRMIHTSELNALRAYGDQTRLEMMKSRVARELKDLRNKFDRTLEFWAANAIRGRIYDADLTTILVDYNLNSTHRPTLENTDLWSDPDDSDPISDIRRWKQLVEDDSGHEISGWHAWCGSKVMDALIKHEKLQDLMKYQQGADLVKNARIRVIDEVTIQEYNGSYKNAAGTRLRFIPATSFVLIGEGDEVFDAPYAPVVDDDAPGGIGNVDARGKGTLFFAKSWSEKDPSGRWIKGESRPLPVLLRPDAVIDATVVSA